MERVIFENSQVRVVEFKSRYFVDEIMDGEVVNSSIGMEFEDLNDYLHDAGLRYSFIKEEV